MRFTNTDKVNGEMAARSLSKKAQDYYNTQDYMTIYEKNGDLYLDGDKPEKMTLDEINRTLEFFADECE